MIAIRDCDGRGRRTDRGQAHTTDEVRDPLQGGPFARGLSYVDVSSVSG